ncbi:porin [Limnohabitans sp. Rim47]|uniref:porin n=1 Tax=Limnohabitans sp. Rim47 TaxID=1100721 RepID=UPI00037519EB|nr:porin [Limnohabitans sp. Rim47]
MAAVSGTAFAQSSVSLTGKFGYAYTDAKTAAGVKTAGFQATDGDLVAAAVEDLGGGLKANASLALKLRGRGAQASVVDGRDATIGLSGAFGSITAGAIEAGNGIMGLGQAGAPVIGLDGKVLDGAVNVDIVSYTLPTLATGLTLKASVIDGVGDVARTKGNISVFAVGYTAGALNLSADFSDYSKYADAAAVGGTYLPSASQTLTAYAATDTLPSGATVVAAATAAVKAVDNRTRVSASYNLGVATVGLGYQVKSYVTAANKDNKQMTYGVSAPLGAFTVGAVYASSKDDGATTKTTGNEFGVNYAFSQRTSLQVARASWKKTGAAADTLLRARLLHSF